MILSLNFIIAYLLGGLTFIPLTIVLLGSAYFIYNQVIFPIYSIFNKFDNNSGRKNNNNYIDRTLSDNNIDSSSSLLQKGELPNDDSTTTTTNNPLYKVGWLKVSRRDNNEEKDNNSIGDMVISYISGNKKQANNNYFAVLKYSTLYLYDSEKQLDCKGVIILNNYQVSTWPPGLQDFELFSKPHTIRLKSQETTFYVNCNKCIDKEDWFFTFIRASKQQANKKDKTHFDQSAMNHLITMVHSDEHHFQTQWLNAILGRLFFGVYRTDLVKNALYKKVMSKLDKINSKRPPFLGEINVRSVDPGHALPHFTQPKLLGLSPTGELTAEAYMQYDGGFRIEIETSLLWKYSDRLKPLTLDLVLGITLKHIEGKILIKIKEPPTNRFWYGFYECPKMEWKVEPVVWEKRVGYSVVVKAIETKIQEFIMETMVLPHFDDITFFPTNGVGGIFEVSPDKQEEEEGVQEEKASAEVPASTTTNSTSTAPVAESTSTTTSAASIASTSTSTSTSTSIAACTTTDNNNKKSKDAQQKRDDEALLTTAKSLPELFSGITDRPQQHQLSKLRTQLQDDSDQLPYNSTSYTNSAPSSPTSANSIIITKNNNISCSPRLIPATSNDSSVTGQIAITNPNNSHDSSILSTSPDYSFMSTSPTLLLDNNSLTQVLTDDSTSSSLSSDKAMIQITYSQDYTNTTAADTATMKSSTSEQTSRLRKSSSLALLKPKTGASTAINVSPAMAHKQQDTKKDIDSISVAVI
jgi:hypothetical protein